uniref:Acyltransferase n=1 Tax=Panagrellus redivivus TaxID=6233 RepID=A0A7E4VYP7_PANRE
MSQTSNGSAIKRFTYDWLIRFAELHPFQSFYFDGHPSVAFNLLTSKYAAISPIFARLIIRHMPYLYYGNQLHVSNRKIVKKFGLQPDLQSFELPSPKKYSIYICGVCHITELTPDLFTWFEDNRIIFYGEHIYMTKSGATVVNDPSPNTSGPRLQQFHNERMLLFSTTTLTEPIDFSEVCPFLAHYKYITLYIPVIYGTSFTNIARKNQFTPERFYVFEQDVSDNVMLEMVDYFLDALDRGRRRTGVSLTVNFVSGFFEQVRSRELKKQAQNEHDYLDKGYV